jgi:hypothetical protein
MLFQNSFSVAITPPSITFQRRIDYSLLLSKQIALLEEHNIPKEITERFNELQQKAIKHALSIISPIGECILIPVIPRVLIPLGVQMSLLHIGHRHGTSQLCDEVINDNLPSLNPTLRQPYYIVDVDFGLKQSEIAPRDLNRILLTSFPQKRRGLIPEEAIALAVFTGLHLHHNICCAASEYLNMMPIIAQKTVPLNERTSNEPNDAFERVLQPVLARTDPRFTDNKKKIPTCDIHTFTW